MTDDWMTRMRIDWDRRAREDWLHYVLDDGTEDEHAFFESGRRYLRVHEEKYLPEGVKINPKWSILDVGCGVGRMSFAFGEVCKKVMGIDISPEMIQRAKAFNDQRFQMDHVHFAVTNGLDLRDYADEKFDMVYCGLVLGHVPSQEIIVRYLEEFHRVLKPGGYCIAMTQDYGPSDPQNPTGQGARFGASELYAAIVEKEIGFQVLRTSIYGHLGFWFGLRRHTEGSEFRLFDSLLRSMLLSLRQREGKLREYLLGDPDRAPYGDYVYLKRDAATNA